MKLEFRIGAIKFLHAASFAREARAGRPLNQSEKSTAAKRSRDDQGPCFWSALEQVPFLAGVDLFFFSPGTPGAQPFQRPKPINK